MLKFTQHSSRLKNRIRFYFTKSKILTENKPIFSFHAVGHVNHPINQTLAEHGPLRWFYYNNPETILQPAYSGKSAWKCLGAITGVNLIILLAWNGDTLTQEEVIAIHQRIHEQDPFLTDREVEALALHDSKKDSMSKHFSVNVTNLVEGRPWTLLTASFSHQDPAHFFGNMFALWLFGFKAIKVIGPSRFVGLYATGGILCSLAHCAHNYINGRVGPPIYAWEQRSLLLLSQQLTFDGLKKKVQERIQSADMGSLGASGSVMAIASASAFLFPLDKIVRGQFFISIPTAVALYILSDLSGLFNEGSNVDHAGHLGGMVAGMGYILAQWYLVGRLRAIHQIASHHGGAIPLLYRLNQRWKKTH